MRISIAVGSRRAALLATGVLALASAEAAHAGGFQNEYSGTPKGTDSGYIGLDVNRRSNVRVVENINVSVPTTCADGSTGFTTGTTSGRIRINQKRSTFAGRRDYGNVVFGGQTEGTIKIEGKVVSRQVVRGSLRIRDSRPDGDGVRRCDTGVVEFRITRSQPVD